jgi:TolB-like protein/Tfp pilus assembly protein PilF
MADVFLSYKAEDRPRVKPLRDALTAEGLSVWWDVEIEGGAAWRETIHENLKAAACVIVVWSEASVGPAGHFVHDEASRAKRRGVYLPVSIDHVEPPLGFGQDQALKLVGWRGARRDPRFTDVLAAARALIEGGPRPIPKARARAIRRPPGISPAAIGLAALLAIIAAAGLFVATSPSRLCAVAKVGCPPPPRPAPPNSIAVLPLANLSGQGSETYFVDGLTDEMISRLGRLGGLQVVGRTSSFKFRGAKDPSAVIGRKLDVAYLLDGSVQRDGSHLRVSVSLIDAPSGFERWSETYDREMTDVFAVESGIAQAVAEALKVRLPAGGVAVVALGGTHDTTAYDAYLRGRQVFDKGGEERAYRDALAQFDAAIAADPAYAVAYAARARVLLTIGNTFAPPEKVRATFDAALASARRAVALAPDLPIAQAALGEALMYGRLDFRAAKPAFAQAMAKGGGEAEILTLYALFASSAGDPAAAVAAARRATVLDPLNPRAFAVLGKALSDAGRYADAIVARRRELALNPSRASAHAAIGDALYFQGQYAEARREYALEPVDFLRLTGEAIVLRRLGDTAGAQAALARLTADAKDTTFFQQAEVHAQWGETDLAYRALEDAFTASDSGLQNLKVDPMLAPLRGQARFSRLLERLHLN